MVNDKLFGLDTKLSYSRFTLLKCPVKYYITKFIGIQFYSIASLIGIVVHKIYEDLLTNKITIHDAKKKETILNYVNQCLTIYKIPSIKINTDLLIDTISNHIWDDLLVYVNRHVENGFKLKVESEHMIDYVSIFNSELQTYIRPDIYLTNDKQIKLIDIKTAKRYRPEFKDQLIFYLKVLSEEYKDIENFVGLIYLSQYGEMKQVLLLNRKQLNKEFFNKILNPVERLYRELGIQTLSDIKNFVKKVTKYDETTLFNIRCKLYNYVGNVCSICPIKKQCPIFNLKQSTDFSKLISGETKEDLIVITSSYTLEDYELVGFVET